MTHHHLTTLSEEDEEEALLATMRTQDQTFRLNYLESHCAEQLCAKDRDLVPDDKYPSSGCESNSSEVTSASMTHSKRSNP